LATKTASCEYALHSFLGYVIASSTVQTTVNNKHLSRSLLLSALRSNNSSLLDTR